MKFQDKENRYFLNTEKLRNIMKTKGIKYIWLSEQIGTTRQNLNNLLRNKSVAYVEEMEEALNLRQGQLVIKVTKKRKEYEDGKKQVQKR